MWFTLGCTILYLPVWCRAASYSTAEIWISRRWRRARILEWQPAGWRGRRVRAVTGSGRVAIKIRGEAARCARTAGSGHRIRWARNIQVWGIRAEAVIPMTLRAHNWYGYYTSRSSRDINEDRESPSKIILYSSCILSVPHLFFIHLDKSYILYAIITKWKINQYHLGAWGDLDATEIERLICYAKLQQVETRVALRIELEPSNLRFRLNSMSDFAFRKDNRKRWGIFLWAHMFRGTWTTSNWNAILCDSARARQESASFRSGRNLTLVRIKGRRDDMRSNKVVWLGAANSWSIEIVFTRRTFYLHLFFVYAYIIYWKPVTNEDPILFSETEIFDIAKGNW